MPVDTLLVPIVLSPHKPQQLMQVVFPLLRASACQPCSGKGFTRQKMFSQPLLLACSLQQQRVFERLPSPCPKMHLAKTISKNSSVFNSPAGVSTHRLLGGFRFGMKSNYYRGAV